jgi:hypothetical protein
MKVAARNNYLGIEFIWPWTDETIALAPDSPGVFAFFDDRNGVILIESSTFSIKEDLEDHWKGYKGGATCGAAKVGFEKHRQSLIRKAEL